MQVLQHQGQREQRHRHHPSGAGSGALHEHRRKYVPGQRAGQKVRHRLGQDPRGGHPVSEDRRPDRFLQDPHQGHRRRQAADGRDRQGPGQERASANPGRAHLLPQRGGLPGPAGPASPVQEAGDDLDHHLPQDQRGLLCGGRHHHPPRRPHHRDAHQGRGRLQRGPHHPRHGRPRARGPLPETPRRRDRRGVARGQKLDRLSPGLHGEEGHR